MWLNEVTAYIRENHQMMMMAFAGLVILCLLVILFQVSRTHRKVHKICKKIRKYFDVILTEETGEKAADLTTAMEKQPEYSSVESAQRQKESLQKQKDAKLLMDVISDVF